MQFGDKVIALFHLIRFCFIILYVNPHPLYFPNYFIKLIFNKNIKGCLKKKCSVWDVKTQAVRIFSFTIYVNIFTAAAM